MEDPQLSPIRDASGSQPVHQSKNNVHTRLSHSVRADTADASHSLDSYIPLLTAAVRIPPPTDEELTLTSASTSSGGLGQSASLSHRSRLASFPPPQSKQAKRAQDGSRDGATLPTSTNFGEKGSHAGNVSGSSTEKSGSSGLSGGVADMLLSAILPSSVQIPKTAPSSSGQSVSTKPHTGPPYVSRPLTSQREPLSLPSMSNAFRRFVARCGVVFWIMDRVEEVLYWKKPIWTYAWFLGWGLISFYPRLLLAVPSFVLCILILHSWERSHPSATSSPVAPATTGTANPAPPTQTSNASNPSSRSIFNKPIAATIAASLTSNTETLTRQRSSSSAQSEDDKAQASTVDDHGKEIPANASGAAESGVDYFMNIQGIQNLMAVVSDVYDAVLPWTAVFAPSAAHPHPPTNFPISSTHLLIVCLIPTLGLPLLPQAAIPWLLMSLGYTPPILFHPAMDAVDFGTRARQLRHLRAQVERKLLTDRLDDHIARSEIREVHVWENERLDPAWVKSALAKYNPAQPASMTDVGVPTEDDWSARYLKTTDKRPWVKALPKNPSDTLWEDDAQRQAEDVARVSLRLVTGWSFVPGEEWRIDYAATWANGLADDKSAVGSSRGARSRPSHEASQVVEKGVQ